MVPPFETACAAALLAALAGAVLQRRFNRSWEARLRACEVEVRELAEIVSQLADLHEEGTRRMASEVGALESRLIDVSLPAHRTMPLERRHKILALARNGVPAAEIASRLNVPRGEAELIVNLKRFTEARGGRPEASGGPRSAR